jgi:hypothetical protein
MFFPQMQAGRNQYSRKGAGKEYGSRGERERVIGTAAMATSSTKRQKKK